MALREGVINFVYLCQEFFNRDYENNIDEITSCIQRGTFLKSFVAEIIHDHEFTLDMERDFFEIDTHITEKIKIMSEQLLTLKQKIGRPKYDISREEIEGLKSMGFTWKKISELLSISERTLRTRRHELEVSEKYEDIDDVRLDGIIQEILEQSPNMGEIMLQGAIQSRGINIQRRRLRASIERVDPVGRELRRLMCLKRRSYSVESPNALW